jgi:hypothetical protein
MTNLLPILLLGGGALLVMKKKKKKKKPAEVDATGKPARVEKEPVKPPVPEPDLGEEDEIEPTPPEPVPDDLPEPGPAPVPEPGPEPEPQPGKKRPLGPSGVGTCVQYLYNRDPEPLDPAIGKVLSTQAAQAFPEELWHFYIRTAAQVKIYNAVSAQFLRMMQGQERRRLASTVLREEMEEINSGCNWEGPIESLSKPEQLVWEDAKRLVHLAMLMTGFRDPAPETLFKTGKRLTVPRAAFGDPDPGIPQDGLSIDQRVEIVATDLGMENAEHLIGKVSRLTGPNGEKNLFEIQIVGKFQGQDVSPGLTEKHGFKFFSETNQGSNAFFSRKGPTGIYRIFPKGVT